MCEEFAKLIGSEFEIRMIGELNFFLDLQVKQTENRMIICQQEYMKELVKRFKIDNAKIIDTPIATAIQLDMDESGSFIDEKLYGSMIGSLLYLTTSRPNIVFSVGLCARFQSNSKESYLKAIKRFLRYLKGTQDLFLWMRWYF